MKTQSKDTQSFLRRLRDNTSGNAMMMSVAAIIPLVGVIGGGLDTSRAYLAKSRLQQACDSATLAARKQLAGNVVAAGEIPAEVQDAADSFFSNNFRTGMYGTQGDTFVLSAQGDTTMHGEASVEVPTTLMSVFGFEKFDLEVTCSAELNLPNIDVVLVLDMSGSMAGSRVADLKEAVFEFYDEVMEVKPDSARIRVGVVPYSGAVNVGSMLLDEDPDFLADSFAYQSREAFFELISNNDGVEIGDRLDETETTELLPREPVQLGSDNSAHYHFNKNNKDKKQDCLDYAGIYVVDGATWVVENPKWLPNYWKHWPNNQKAACRADIEKFRVAGPGDEKEETFREEFDYYVYREMDLDTSRFKLGDAVTLPTGTKGADVTSTWNGCIEERGTVATTNFSPIPGLAYDLDIDLIPSAGDPDTQWKPMWPQITYDRGGPDEWQTTTNRSTRRFSCPDPALRLTEFPLSGGSRNAAFESYINNLNPSGYTLHDIGMIWAGRMISPDGIFGADNQSAPNGDPIARHIIFMTDGEIRPGPSWTTSFGNYDMDGRMAGFAADGTWRESDLAVIHNARLDAICARIKNKNVTIWTVAFELPLNAHTEGCSTGTGRAFAAADGDALTDAFKKIAGSIAELRLVE
ncbi:TadE/TadG family type IV pilus assembly protein [Erythrobacter ani]|uniref:TadE/TadG family protein n=1 Tax=Erythrobacter ani TaxID=2827235 RepID=A0ABS6SNQ3_9SPHN|nr:TadE/TadG family type IV pilus assembly protein [Erythrobacter ani]MBV7266274.1 TadE/TadG family protein [Erythrobacter ani]